MRKGRIKPRIGDVAYVDLVNVKVIFLEEEIIDDIDIEGNVLESHTGMVMKILDGNRPYNGEPALIIEHVYFVSE